MKKYFAVSLITLALVSFTACNKRNGCPNNSEKVIVRDFSESDSCGMVFELEDGDGSEDSRASSFEYVEKDGDFLRSGERLKFVSPRRCY